MTEKPYSCHLNNTVAYTRLATSVDMSTFIGEICKNPFLDEELKATYGFLERQNQSFPEITN